MRRAEQVNHAGSCGQICRAGKPDQPGRAAWFPAPGRSCIRLRCPTRHQFSLYQDQRPLPPHLVHTSGVVGRGRGPEPIIT